MRKIGEDDMEKNLGRHMLSRNLTRKYEKERNEDKDGNSEHDETVAN